MNKLEIKIYQLKTGHYMISYINPSSKKRVRKRFKTKKEAKEHRSELQRRFAHDKIDSFGDAYVNQLMADHLKKYPKSGVRSRKNHFIDFCDSFGHFKIGELRKHHIEEWFEKKRVANNLTEKTMARIKTQLNHFFNWLLDEGILEKSPLEKVKYRNNTAPLRARVILSFNEIQDILEKLKVFSPNGLYPICYTLIYTGARRMEVLKLKWEDIDFSNKLITFRNTKNGDDRSIKMAESLYCLLYNRKRSSDFVFVNKFNEMFSGSQLSRQLKHFKQTFAIEKDFKPHDFRHSFAFNYLKKGGDMYQLKAILGHKSIQMTVDLYGEMKAQHVDNPCPYE